MTKIGKKNSKRQPFEKKNSSDIPVWLKNACSELVYISETDAPIIPFSGTPVETVSAKAAATAAGIEYREPAEMVTTKAFFARLTEGKDWFGPVEQEKADRFRELQALLETHLKDLSVYRFGKVRIDIVAAGADKRSRLVGFRTYAVET